MNHIDELAKKIKKFGIKHFTLEELLRASNRVPPEKYCDNIIPTLLVADAMREDLGFRIIVPSAFRTPSHNEFEGGEVWSLHLKFNALDLQADPFTEDRLTEMQNWLLSDWKVGYNGGFITPDDCGIGTSYETIIHIDTRGICTDRKAPARW